MEGPLGRVQINSNGLEVDGMQGALKLLPSASSLSAQGSLGLSAGTTLTMSGQNAVTLQTPGLFSASGTVTSIGGTQILLNGSGCGLLRPTDVASALGPGGGTILLNPNGSANLRTSC